MMILDLKLAELKEYENNPRHNDDAVAGVAASIKEFGFKVPIVIDANRVIINGHTRYKAAKKLGLKTVPCLVADDLTEDQVKAFRLADNKVAEASTWDWEALSIELSEIELDMGGFGFDLDLYLDEDEVEEEAIDLPEQPNPPEEPKPETKDSGSLECECPECGFRFELSNGKK